MFPAYTCEPIQSGPIHQPWSFSINVATALIVLAMIPKLSRPVQVVAVSIIVFELFHAASHARHLPGHIQQYVIHALTYAIAGTLFWAFFVTTRSLPPIWWFSILLLIIATDLYLITSGDLFLSIPSGVAVLFWIVLGYSRFFPTGVMICLIIMGVIGVALLFNERHNCERMMKAQIFPYHVFIETVTSASFILLVWSMKNYIKL